MAKIICDTSPLQYLHQIDCLDIVQRLVGELVVPPAVVEELNEGKRLGVNLPDLATLGWVTVETPVSAPALPLIADLGAGETQVLMLALEAPGSTVILDDALAREVAALRGIRLTGTLGLLLNAKQNGLLPQVAPLLEQLRLLGFRISFRTLQAVVVQAGEN